MATRTLIAGLAALVLAATPGNAAAQTAVTVTAPAWSRSITDAEVAHWTGKTGSAASRDEALTFLISAAWTEGEAFERGITLTRTQTEQELEELIALSYPSEAAFRRQLKKSGLTRADMLAMLRDDALKTAIQDQIRQPAAKGVTPEQIEAYVLANPRTLPERRRVRVVHTASRKDATQALQALRRGLTWRTAQRRYGRAQDDGSEAVEAQPNARGYHRAVLRAEPSLLTRYGTYVFKVVKVTPERPAPLADQRATAWEFLSSEAQKHASEAFAVAFRAKWLERTTCAPVYAGHADCGTGNPPTGEYW